MKISARALCSFVAVSCCTVVASCGGYKSVYDVAKPSEVTVDHALADVGRGLASMKREMNAGGLARAGVLVDEITLDLNVTASADRTGKLVVDMSSPIELTSAGAGNLKANSESTSSDKASRSNKITIKLKNWYTASLNQQGQKNSGRPDDVLIDPTK